MAPNKADYYWRIAGNKEWLQQWLEKKEEDKKWKAKWAQEQKEAEEAWISSDT